MIVIIGAGKTGRGLIARFAAADGHPIVFIDQSESLIRRLNETGSFTVDFFGGRRNSVEISGTRAVLAGTAEAQDAIADASLVFTAVGEQNLPGVAEDLVHGLMLRRLRTRHPLPVITCENGVAPGKTLQQAIRGAVSQVDALASKESKQVQQSIGVKDSHNIVVTEAAVFCTTIEQSARTLDIGSELYDELPFDPEPLRGLPVPTMHAMVPVDDFKSLLTRKIYTYNCLSACIAYLGALKGYTVYAEAANDPDIRRLLDYILDPLNHAICVKLAVEPQEQKKFALQALAKFSDPNIRDDIQRNARDVARKLGPDERLVAPAMMMMEYGDKVDGLALVMAAALHYGGNHEPDIREMLSKHGPSIAFARLSNLPSHHEITQLVQTYFDALADIENGLNSGIFDIISG